MPYDPSTLAKKQAWIRAKDHATGAVTTLIDASGQAYDATGTGATVTASSTPAGGKAFVGTNMHYVFPTSSLFLSGTLMASASSVFGGNLASNAVDGNAANLWASTTNTGWLMVRRTKEPAAATSYSITPGASGPNQFPKTWTFEGSMNGTSGWVTLDTRTNITFSAGVKQTFSFSNTTAYRYYRVNITANNGDALVALAELELDGQANNTTVPDGEMWIVLKTNGGSGPQAWGYGTSGQASHYTYGGLVYDDFGATSRPSFTPTKDTSQWRLYRVQASGTTWKAWLDNVQQLSTSITKSWRSSPIALDTFSGAVAEIMLLSPPPTSEEAANLTGYFNSEHGLWVPNYATEVLSDSRSFYFRFSETSGAASADSTGNGFVATWNGTYARNALGLLPSDPTNPAVSITGSGYAEIPYSAALNLPTIGIEALIKPAAIGSTMQIVDRDQGIGDRIFQFRLNSAGKIEFLWWTSTAGPFGVTGTTTFVAGNSYDVACDYDGSVGRVLVNGVVEGTTAQAGVMKTPAFTSIPIRIGAGADSGITNKFSGTVDEVSFGPSLSTTRYAVHAAAVGVAAASPTAGFWGILQAVGTSIPVLATDNFNRADTTTGLGMTSDGLQTWAYLAGGGASAFRVLSNKLVGIPVGIRGLAIISPGPRTDYTISARQQVAGASNGGLTLRVTDGNNYYTATAQSGTYEIWRRVFGSNWDRLSAAGTVTPVVGDLVEFSASGPNLTLKVNGATIASASDGFMTSGSVGFMQENTATAISYDDFQLV